MPHWSSKLVHWFLKNQRYMPWRHDSTPYRTWVSEMMLQQTQVDTVIPYFNRFMTRFPTVQSLALASQQDVLKHWEGLGYYSRARNLHKASKLVIEMFQGEVPSDYDSLLSLPGIGPYCAAAIGSIAFGSPIPVVDGNVLRVFTRFWGIHDDIRLPKTRDEIFNRLSPAIQTQNPSDFNQGIMELGALICTPKNPSCDLCPIQSDCVAYHQDLVETLPVKSPSKKSPHYHIGVGVIWKADQILIGKRKETQMLGGLWEFPGGKQKGKESIEETVLREVREETGLEVSIASKYGEVKHAYTHFKITLHAYKCWYRSGVPLPISTDEVKWISPSDYDHYPFPTANKKIFSLITL